MCTISDSNETSLCSLPRELVFNCLLHVPRIDHLNVSCVSKTLRSLVRSPEFNREFNRLRSFRKGSVYVSFFDNTHHYHWFTLRPIEKSKNIEYQLRPVSFPIPVSIPDRPRSPSTSVAVGSEIYFVGGLYRKPSSDLWIFDTRSEKLTQGPNMKVSRAGYYTVGVVDGKIYVMGGERQGEIQVEVFDPKSQSWNYFPGKEKVDCKTWLTASLEGKVYRLIPGSGGTEISAYNPNARDGRREEEIITRKEKKEGWDQVECVCVVENVLYACFLYGGLMWFDTKLKMWKKLVRRDGKPLFNFSVTAMAEYNGKLAVFWPDDEVDYWMWEKNVMCGLIALDRVGQGICGKVKWSGVVATIPNGYDLRHCLAVSDW